MIKTWKTISEVLNKTKKKKHFPQFSQDDNKWSEKSLKNWKLQTLLMNCLSISLKKTCY